jgi:hypothetical protein
MVSVSLFEKEVLTVIALLVWLVNTILGEEAEETKEEVQ